MCALVALGASEPPVATELCCNGISPATLVALLQVLVRRGEPIPEGTGPIVICTRNDDLEDIVANTPVDRRSGAPSWLHSLHRLSSPALKAVPRSSRRRPTGHAAVQT